MGEKIGTRLKFENSALCRFSIDLARTRPLSLTWNSSSLALPWYSSRTDTISTATWQAPQGALQVTALYTFVQADFNAKTFGTLKQAKHAGTQYRRSSPRKPIQRLWIFGCTRLFECVASIEPPVMAFRSQNSLEIAIPAFLSPFVG